MKFKYNIFLKFAWFWKITHTIGVFTVGGGQAGLWLPMDCALQKMPEEKKSHVDARSEPFSYYVYQSIFYNDINVIS